MTPNPYFFCWYLGTNNARHAEYSFGLVAEVTGHVTWDDVEELENWEIGQLLGGN